MADKLNIITVKGAKDDSKVVLWEKHPDHPDGEAFVVNDGKAYKVAETAKVKQLIGFGELERAHGAPAGGGKSEAKNGSQSAPPTDQPFDGYDALSVEAVIAKARDLDDEGRARVLAYEQANRKRVGVVQPLVNWNSGKS